MTLHGELETIGKIHQTDKALPICFGKSYLDIYEIYFDQYRDTVKSVLEFGVAAGGSLRTWRDYFPNAKVYGVDVNPDALSRECERVHVMCCSQDSEEVIMLAEAVGGFDIVIDDGSHINELTVATFKNIFPHVKRGGFYVIEDMGLTHDTNVAYDTVRGGWPGMQYNRSGINLINKREQIDNMLRPLIKTMDESEGDIEYFHFWSKTLIIRKV